MPGQRFDMNQLMRQAQEMQAQMARAQEQLANETVEASAGGGLVTVKLTAKGDLRGTRIDDSLLKPSEKEILEDLLVAAHADARRKADEVMKEKMQGLTGGLPIPPGLKLF